MLEFAGSIAASILLMAFGGAIFLSVYRKRRNMAALEAMLLKRLAKGQAFKSILIADAMDEGYSAQDASVALINLSVTGRVSSFAESYPSARYGIRIHEMVYTLPH